MFEKTLSEIFRAQVNIGKKIRRTFTLRTLFLLIVVYNMSIYPLIFWRKDLLPKTKLPYIHTFTFTFLLLPMQRHTRIQLLPNLPILVQ